MKHELLAYIDLPRPCILLPAGMKNPENSLYTQLSTGIYQKVDDLFEDYQLQPKKLAKIIKKHSESKEDDMDYPELEAMLKDCEAIGYTFEYGLDACCYALRKMPTCVIREDMREVLIPVGDGDYIQYLDDDQSFYYRWIPTDSEGGEKFQILTTANGWQDAESADFGGFLTKRLTDES